MVCPTITVLYHNSGNFVTAPRSFLHSPATSPLFMPSYSPQHPILKQHLTQLGLKNTYSVFYLSSSNNNSHATVLLFHFFSMLSSPYPRHLPYCERTILFPVHGSLCPALSALSSPPSLNLRTVKFASMLESRQLLSDEFP